MNMNNPLMRRSSLKQSNNNFNSIKKSFNHQNSLVQPILMGSIKQSNIRKSNIRQSNINYIEQDEQQLPHELTMNKKVSTKSNKKSYMPPLDSMVRVQIEQDSMEDLNNTHRSHNRHRSNNSNNNYNNYNNNNYDNINYGNNNDNIM